MWLVSEITSSSTGVILGLLQQENCNRTFIQHTPVEVMEHIRLTFPLQPGRRSGVLKFAGHYESTQMAAFIDPSQWKSQLCAQGFRPDRTQRLVSHLS
jgi:hypothetical protein